MLFSPTPRGLCRHCLHPPLTCYCETLRRFDPGIRFVILIHGREAQKRIATGRLAFLSLERAELLPGYDYSEHPRVGELLGDPTKHCVALYPGPAARNLSHEAAPARVGPVDRELVVFVIDGTWITARKTMQRSRNLAALPQICFTPPAPSRFRVRKQPRELCLSSVEAIHHTIELLGAGRGFAVNTRKHDALLDTFDHMVEQQLTLSSQPKRYCQWRPPRRRERARPDES